MKINELRKKIQKDYPMIEVKEQDGCVLLTGELEKYEDIIKLGFLSVDKKRYIGVLNNIKLKGYQEIPMRLPKVNDLSLDKKVVDVLVIGGGISGASILRELSRYKISTLLVEKESDLAMQASGRNDGEVHPGVDLKKGTLKQHYVVLANPVFGEVCQELGVKFRRPGQYGCFDQPIYPFVKLFALQRNTIGCPTTMAKKEEIHKTDPYLSNSIKFAISNPQSGIASPYELTIAYAENAVENGASVSLDTAVLSMEVKDHKIISVTTNRGIIYPKVVINAAGCFADKIAEMAEDRYFTIHPRSGTDYIFDKKNSYAVNHICAIKHLGSTGDKHTKGGGILPTVDGNVLIGPNAYEVPEREDFSTRVESLDKVYKKQVGCNPSLDKRNIIAYFTGTRAATYEEDFYIHKGRKTENIVHCAGIQSPGFTTSVVVSKDVAKMAIEVLSKYLKVENNPTFNPIRKSYPHLKELDDNERAKLIKENPLYGKIVCRCEEISEGEIIDALNSPIKVPTINGIKRRVRAGMGRCQGGFCMPQVLKIIAEHEHLPLNMIDGKSTGYPVVFSEKKGDTYHE